MDVAYFERISLGYSVGGRFQIFWRSGCLLMLLSILLIITFCLGNLLKSITYCALECKDASLINWSNIGVKLDPIYCWYGTGINWCLKAPAGGCFLADWLLTTSQARQILRGHIIWRPLSLADNSIVEWGPGGKDLPCYASSLAGVSWRSGGERRYQFCCCQAVPSSKSENGWQFSRNHSEAAWKKVPKFTKLEQEREKTCLREEGSQLAPSFVGMIGECSGDYEGALHSISTWLALRGNLHCGILTLVLQIGYFGLMKSDCISQCNKYQDINQ